MQRSEFLDSEDVAETNFPQPMEIYGVMTVGTIGPDAQRQPPCCSEAFSKDRIPKEGRRPLALARRRQDSQRGDARAKLIAKATQSARRPPNTPAGARLESDPRRNAAAWTTPQGLFAIASCRRRFLLISTVDCMTPSHWPGRQQRKCGGVRSVNL